VGVRKVKDVLLTNTELGINFEKAWKSYIAAAACWSNDPLSKWLCFPCYPRMYLDKGWRWGSEKCSGRV